jgi:hypothetical protein
MRHRDAILPALLGTLLTSCGGVQIKGEPVRPGDITGKPDTPPTEERSSAERAAPSVEWSAEAVMQEVDSRELPEGAAGAIGCVEMEGPDTSLDRAAYREAGCTTLVGDADQPEKIEGEPTVEGVRDIPACGSEDRRINYCWSAEGRLIADWSGFNVDRGEARIRDYDTPEFADDPAETRLTPRSGYCQRQFWDGNVFYEVRDTDGDGQIDKGRRILHGPLGQLVRKDSLLIEEGTYVPNRRYEWEGTSYTEYAVDDANDYKQAMSKGETDGQGNVVRTEGLSRMKTVMTFEHDDAGRVIRTTRRRKPGEPIDFIEEWRYDDQGRLLYHLRNQTNKDYQEKHEYGYAPHGRVSGTSTWTGHPPAEHIWEYDDQKRLTFVRTPTDPNSHSLLRVEWNPNEPRFTQHSKQQRFDEDNPPSPESIDRSFEAFRKMTFWYGCFEE